MCLSVSVCVGASIISKAGLCIQVCWLYLVLAQAKLDTTGRFLISDDKLTALYWIPLQHLPLNYVDVKNLVMRDEIFVSRNSWSPARIPNHFSSMHLKRIYRFKVSEFIFQGNRNNGIFDGDVHDWNTCDAIKAFIRSCMDIACTVKFLSLFSL